MKSKINIVFIILSFYYFNLSKSMLSSVSSKKSFESTMDMSLCNEAFHLIRFLIETQKNIFRTQLELSEVLNPEYPSNQLNVSNYVCHGSGKIYTNKLKKMSSNIHISIEHFYEWKNLSDSQRFIKKYLLKIKCPNNSYLCQNIGELIKETDFDSSIGKFEFSEVKKLLQNNTIELEMNEYKDRNKSYIKTLI